jgi:cell division protein FtsB
MIHIFNDKENNAEISDNTISLNQGSAFNNYQTKIMDNLEEKDECLDIKEGFNGGVLTNETNKVIRSNDYSSQQSQITKLRQEYEATLKEYKDLSEKIEKEVNNYVERVDPRNRFLNRLIRFTNGTICYVTNQGVAKPIGNLTILNSLKVPKNRIQLNIPWQSSYRTPGTLIPTKPPLISGTSVKMNQTFGNEGSNVFVNQLLPRGTSASYMGCYATSPNNDNMTFIGGAPPSADISIQNGNFSQPVLQNNTFKIIKGSSEVPGWNFGDSILLNNSRAWGFPLPYPSGNQCVAIKRLTFISTVVKLSAGINYTLTFFACGRRCCTATNPGNPLNIQLYTSNNAFISQVYNFKPTVNSWRKYSTTFKVPTTQSYQLYFKGTSSDGDRTTAIQNIRLSGTSSTSGNYTYSDCMNTAIQSGYQYFALQNVNTSTSKGYCAVSNDSPSITQYGTAQVPSKMIVLWSSNTSRQPGNTARLTDRGILQVVNSGGRVVYQTRSTSPAGNHFLTLQDDGNMVIYSGTNPSNNRGQIWSTNTAGKQQSANPRMKATNGKYGENFIASGSTLAGGDFIGSSDGKTALVMLSDGNLVLYTYAMTTNCQRMNDRRIGGGELANATYDIGVRAESETMGRLAYIDANSELLVYPSNNKQFKNTYTTFKNLNARGNDIPGASYGNATISSCQTTCNKRQDCAGFVFDNNKTCYPKNNKMYPYGGTADKSINVDTYLRDVIPSKPPIGVSQNTANIDTIKYSSYSNGGKIGSRYGLANMNSVQKKQLEQLQTKMNMLSTQIKNLTGKFGGGTSDATNQSRKNTSSIGGYISNIRATNNKINTISRETSGGIQNILTDSDVIVLQKNYEYLFWSILATGTVLVSMNIANKQ